MTAPSPTFSYFAAGSSDRSVDSAAHSTHAPSSSPPLPAESQFQRNGTQQPQPPPPSLPPSQRQQQQQHERSATETGVLTPGPVLLPGARARDVGDRSVDSSQGAYEPPQYQQKQQSEPYRRRVSFGDLSTPQSSPSTPASSAAAVTPASASTTRRVPTPYPSSRGSDSSGGGGSGGSGGSTSASRFRNLGGYGRFSRYHTPTHEPRGTPASTPAARASLSASSRRHVPPNESFTEDDYDDDNAGGGGRRDSAESAARSSRSPPVGRGLYTPMALPQHEQRRLLYARSQHRRHDSGRTGVHTGASMYAGRSGGGDGIGGNGNESMTDAGGGSTGASRADDPIARGYRGGMTVDDGDTADATTVYDAAAAADADSTHFESVLQHWVTVYGFFAGQQSQVLKEMRNFGQVTRHVARPSNWMHVMYRTPLQAQVALSRAARVIGDGTTMIGTVPCTEPDVVIARVRNGESDEWSASASGVYGDGGGGLFAGASPSVAAAAEATPTTATRTPMSGMSPLDVSGEAGSLTRFASRTRGARTPATPASSVLATQPRRGVISRASEYLFGW